jgi:hypothetical protein
MGQFIAPVQDHWILPARVWPTAGQARVFQMVGRHVPSPLAVRFLIDSGAKRTTLIPGVINRLEAWEGRTVQVLTPFGEQSTTLFWVRIDFPETRLGCQEQIQVARLPMPPALGQFHGLLGRDVLSRWDSLLYEGHRGLITIRDNPGIFGWLRRWL